MPISRFLEYLVSSGNYSRYMDELVNAYNPGTIEGLMCRSMISVGWDGRLYDCDFNQMLDLGLTSSHPQHISDLKAGRLNGRRINVRNHCFGCTAGSGSSCGGEIA